jgi:putative membrane protein
MMAFLGPLGIPLAIAATAGMIGGIAAAVTSVGDVNSAADGKTLWLYLKILCVFILSVYHLYCFKYFFAFKENKNKYSHIFFRWFNELPVAFLIIIILLVVFKPL